MRFGRNRGRKGAAVCCGAGLLILAALLAKNILRFGVPVAWDGASLVSQECGTDYDANYLWRQTPWLPIYLTAVSFALLDAGTFAARLPFALLDLPLRFNTNLEVRGGKGCQSLAGWPPPDCVIVRYFFRFQPAALGARDDAERTLPYLRSEVTPPRHCRVDLPHTVWENSSGRDRHVYRAPDDRPKITLYEKVRP